VVEEVVVVRGRSLRRESDAVGGGAGAVVGVGGGVEGRGVGVGEGWSGEEAGVAVGRGGGVLKLVKR